MRRKRGLTETWYRAPIASGLAHDAQVDFKNHVIRGAVAMEVGPAKGHDEEVDEFTINETVRLGQQLEHGAKSRFGHPELCSDALGAYAGQQKAWRVDPLDSRRALMDIHFSEFALADPSNMVERVMLRARDEPHSFGNSVVLKRDLEYRFEADGKTRLKDADGKELPPLIRPLALLGSDLVDSPAATSALFSAADHEGTSAVYSAAAAEGLDEILGRDDADDRIANFAERFFSTRPEAARRVGDIVEKYADQPTEEVKMSKPEEQVDEPATKADEGDRSLLAKLRSLLSLSAASGDPTASAPEPSTGPVPPILISPLDDSPPRRPEPAPETAALQEQVNALTALVEQERAERRAALAAADLAAYTTRVDAQRVPVGHLTERGAAALMTQGKALLAAGLPLDEVLETTIVPFENAPRIHELAELGRETTFVVGDGTNDTKFEGLSFGTARDDRAGTFFPGGNREETREIATMLAAIKHDDPEVEQKHRLDALRRSVVNGEGW